MIVTLIGYRGCGKSSVGPLLARHLGCDCVDSDDRIEESTGQTIAEIFAADGEAVFRKYETSVLQQLLTSPPLVIAAGGGAILSPVNREHMQAAGPVVWLNASVKTLAHRIGHDAASGDRRPSLTGQSIEAEVETVLNTRLPLYEEAATLIVDADTDSPQAIADKIYRSLNGPDEEAGL